METKRKIVKARGIRLSFKDKRKEAARAYLYILQNDLHKKPFGLLEDVYVEENLRGRGLGTKIINEAIIEARKNKCYKLVATSRYSRPKVHKLYERLGFKNHGLEFRLDFK
ncbi:MAG: GNAT family N-acetyltransferase [Patescibacteria group bacterium]